MPSTKPRGWKFLWGIWKGKCREWMTLPYLWTWKCLEFFKKNLLYMNVRYWRAKKKYTNKANTTLGSLLLHWPSHQTSTQDPSVTNLRRDPDLRPPPLDPPWIRSYAWDTYIIIIGTRLVTVGDNKPYMYIADSGLHASILSLDSWYESIFLEKSPPAKLTHFTFCWHSMALDVDKMFDTEHGHWPYTEAF